MDTVFGWLLVAWGVVSIFVGLVVIAASTRKDPRFECDDDQ